MAKASIAAFMIVVFALAAAAQQAYKVGDGVSAPRILHKVEPEYTQEAKDARVEGTVVLAFEVSEAGNAENIKVTKSLREDLDRNAITALQQWKFAPGEKEGKPVRVKATVEINYRLN